MLGSNESALWPNHFKPLPDELLSSWLVRLAHAHGYKSEQLCSILLGRGEPMWNRDIDRTISIELRDALKKATSATDEQIDAATLVAFAGYVSGQVNALGTSRWIIPLGIFHRKRRTPGLMYCPLCLATDQPSYYRRSWRLSFVTVCTEHHVELRDCCEACAAPIAPHRIDVGRNGYLPRNGLLCLCSSCGRDLRRTIPQKADAHLVAWTAYLQQASMVGFAEWGSNPNLHSVLLFDGIRYALVAILSRVIGCSGDFDLSSLSVRRAAMVEMERMLGARDAAKAVRYAQLHGMRFIDVAGSDVTRPFWTEAIFEPLKRAQQPYHTDEELRAISEALERRYGRISAQLARKVFGANCPHSRLPAYFHQQVSDEAYKALMVSIEHAIGGTFDEHKRLALLQDKLSFAMMRVMGLSAVDLSYMTVAKASTMLPRPSASLHPGFGPVPVTQKQLSRHLWWFIERIRPRIRGADEYPFLFLSCLNGKPIGSNGIGMRFKSAVKRAYLTAAISNMSAFRRIPVASTTSMRPLP